MARQYLGIVATSVPSERLFSVAGMTVSTKQAVLDPANIEKLVFLHSSLEIPHLDCKRAKCTCTNSKPVVHIMILEFVVCNLLQLLDYWQLF